MKKQFEILDKEIVYQGFFRMEKYRLETYPVCRRLER